MRGGNSELAALDCAIDPQHTTTCKKKGASIILNAAYKADWQAQLCLRQVCLSGKHVYHQYHRYAKKILTNILHCEAYSGSIMYEICSCIVTEPDDHPYCQCQIHCGLRMSVQLDEHCAKQT